MTLSPGLREEIQQEAYARYRRYQRDMAGRAQGQEINPRDDLDWWIADVAFERGRNYSFADADREVDFVMDMTDKQVEDDMRWAGECPECAARAFDEAAAKAIAAAGS